MPGTYQVVVFWVVMPCSVAVGYQRFWGPWCLHLQGEDGESKILHGEDAGGKVLWSVCILPQHYTASRLRKPRFESSSPWKPQISHCNIYYSELNIANITLKMAAASSSERWYPSTSLHDVTTQKTAIWNISGGYKFWSSGSHSSRYQLSMLGDSMRLRSKWTSPHPHFIPSLHHTCDSSKSRHQAEYRYVILTNDCVSLKGKAKSNFLRNCLCASPSPHSNETYYTP
jgi:hypothetical protein